MFGRLSNNVKYVDGNRKHQLKTLFNLGCLLLCLELKMLSTFIFFLLFLAIPPSYSTSEDSFTFNGFNGTNLSLEGIASITSNGLLQLTNVTRVKSGHAFYPTPLNFKSPAGKALSFSTTFVFAIIPEYPEASSHGMAFVISPTTNFSTAVGDQFLGLFDLADNGNANDHILAVEFDTIQNPEFNDINDNHVGIDVNSLTSVDSRPAGYHDGNGNLLNLKLYSGLPMQVWIDFDGEDMQLNVTMAPVQVPKPSEPLLSSNINRSGVMLDQMYVGFSAATGSSNCPAHYILGWNFMMIGEAEPLDYRNLPRLPRLKTKRNFKVLAIWLPLATFAFVLLVVAVVVFIVLRRIKFAELLEDWEQEYGPHRFSFKDLFHATDGFKDKELVGTGGFGKVYRGVLPTSNMEVAVKRISHESGQGMKEFVAEIVSIGRLRHRNIAQLLGYCRREGELLLVYDFMPNGSLDRFLHDKSKPCLDWVQRYRIIKGVASGLLYLHEEWVQLVIHRDIKASNVLLDGEMNGRLGDFGLARLCQHGTDPRTTRVIGTLGYLAPELARTGRATTMTDVFAFGAFLLEVVCGRRPLVLDANGEQMVLVDRVLENWRLGSVLSTRDPRLREEEGSGAEMEMVLMLGLLCLHPIAEARPSMRQVMQYLDGDKAVPDLSPAFMGFSYPSLAQEQEYPNLNISSPISVATVSHTTLRGR